MTFSKEALDALYVDLAAFLPELILCGAIVAMLLLRLIGGMSRTHLGGLALTAVGVALAVTIRQWAWASGQSAPDAALPRFTGLVVFDYLTVYVRMFLLGFAALGIVLTFFTNIPDAEDSGDFYVLLLGGTLGMMFMGSANHLLIAYLAIEMASLPSYALAGFLKGRRQSGEAALKYVVYGGGAAGVMLYGISLVAGRFGTGYLPQVAQGIALQLAAGGVDVPLAMGLVLIFIGLAFKLSAVPFHFWTPDVFEGASAEIGAFLSIASKGAAMALTGRLILTVAAGDAEATAKAFGPVLALFAAVTATFGNLAAYAQNNLKRLLAYSTIAHAGYMLMGLAVCNRDGVAAVLFYLATYLFTNLGAFAVVALIRNRTGSEDLRDFAGLIYSAPGLVVALGVCLLSLLGLPPLAGFAGKFVIFSALYHAGDEARQWAPWLSKVYWSLLVIGGLNTAISAFYYVRVLKVMVLDKPADMPSATRPLPFGAVAYAGALAAAVLVLGIAWDSVMKAGDRSVAAFPRSKPLVARGNP